MSYSLDEYRSILAAAKAAGAVFLPFSTRHSGQHEGQKRIYLRHDVDFSLDMALRLAEVNAAEGVLATFFVLLRSPVYNLLSADTLPYLRRIRALGQRLGLHMSLSCPLPLDDAALALLVRTDYAQAQSHVADLDPVYAWHNTTPTLLERGLTLAVDGLVGAYSAPYFREIPYYSDTGMRHTCDEWRRLVSLDHQATQLLFHPELWVGGGATATIALGRAWPSVIREREVEFLRNRVYERDLPGGLPGTLLDQLVAQVEAAAQPTDASHLP